MKRVVLSLPNGNDFFDPNMELIANSLRDPASIFTSDGCGEMSLEYRSPEILSHLGVRHVCEDKYSLEWKITEGVESPDSSSIILRRPLNSDTVIVYVGGTPLHLPEASVVSIDEVLLIAVSFCENGRVPAQWKLVRLSQIPPDLYFWGGSSG